jgi:3-oxoacyl-[acyl-carrier protein] reductase
LVTGASRGLGVACAEALADAGFLVAGVGRDLKTLESQAKRIGQQVFYPFAIDLTANGAVVDLTSEVIKRFGVPDVVVNNAGFGGPYCFLDQTTDEHFAEVMTLGVTVPFMLMRAMLPGMAARRSGRVINIASVLGQSGAVGSAAYTTAKHAIIGLTRAAASEYGNTGVTVNGVCPGFCRTDMTASLQDNVQLLTRIPAERMGEPSEIGSLVAYLASPASGYINGACITIDGGLSADLSPLPVPRAGTHTRGAL